MSFSQLRSGTSLLSTIFPTLSFNGLKFASERNEGFCEKILLKNNKFIFKDFVVQISDYELEGAEIKVALNGKHCEIYIEHAKCKIQILSGEQADLSNNPEINLDINFENLEFDLYKNDEKLFSVSSENSYIKFKPKVSLEASFPSCNVFYQNSIILNNSNFKLLYDYQLSSINCISDYVELFFGSKSFLQMISSFNLFIGNLQVTFSIEQCEIFFNKDTKITCFNFIFTKAPERFLIKSSKCILNLSSYRFSIKSFEINNKKVSIQDVEILNNHFEVKLLKNNENFINSTLDNPTTIKINFCPFEVTLSMNRFQDFTTSFVRNSLVNFVLSLASEKILTLDFLNIKLNLEIDKDYVFHYESNFNFTIQPDITLFGSTNMTYLFNNNPFICQNQIFQYVKKRQNNYFNANILLSPLNFHLSIDEIFPFFNLLVSISNLIKVLFIRGCNVLTIDMQGIHFYFGQSVIGMNERTSFIDVSIMNQPLMFKMSNKEISFSASPVITVKYYNILTAFWDTIIEPFNVSLNFCFSAVKKHIFAIIESQISMNLSVNFLSSLVKMIEKPTAPKMPYAFISNYTDNTIVIAEPKGSQMTIASMSTIPYGFNVFFYIGEERPTKLTIDLITSQTFIKNNIFVNIELKEGIKNIYFMQIWSIENKLGVDINVFMKVKKNVNLLMKLRHNEIHGLPKTATYASNFLAAVACNTTISPPSSPRSSSSSAPKNTSSGIIPDHNNVFIPKKYKAINYLLKGPNVDSDCLIFLGKNPINKVKIMTFLPRYEFENHLPIPISLTIHHCRASITEYFNDYETKPCLFPYDISQLFELSITIGDKVSKPTTINFKEISKLAEFPISFEKCYFRLHVSVSSLQIYKFQLFVPTIIFNLSSLSFLINKQLVQKAKTYSLPLFSHKDCPAIFICDENNPEIEIPATSFSEKIPITSSLLTESHDLLLKMKTKEDIFTPVRTIHQKKTGFSNILYLHDMITVKNNSTYKFSLSLVGSITLYFEPGLVAPISVINQEGIYQMEIEGYQTIERIYLTYPTNTVLRFSPSFQSFQSINNQNEIFIKMNTITNEKGQMIVEFSNASIESAPYLIINNTKHMIYAQHTQKWLPMEILPYSSNIFAFDDPFSKMFVVLTIEGKSIRAYFSRPLRNSLFPFKIAGERLRMSVKALPSGKRAVIIHNDIQVQKIDYSIKVEIPQTIISLLSAHSSQFLTLYTTKTSIQVVTENQDYKVSFTTKAIQVEEDGELVPQNIVISSVSDTIPFINVEIVASKLDISHISSFSATVNKICVQLTNSFLIEFAKFLRESQITNLNLHNRFIKDQPVFATSISISPILLSVFLRRDLNETISIAQDSILQLFTIPSLSNCTFTGVQLNNTSSTVKSIINFVRKIYSNSISHFISCATSQQEQKDRISYPHSQFLSLSLSNDDSLSHDKKASKDNIDVVLEIKDFPSIEDKALINIDNNLVPMNFQYIKDEDQVRNSFAQNAPNRIGYRKLFLLNRIETTDSKVYNDASILLKKKKGCILYYFHSILTANQYAFVFEDTFDVIDISTNQILFSTPLIAIHDAVSERADLKIIMNSEKAKQAPKSFVFKFDSPNTTETMVNEIISHKVQFTNK
ncbi:hypothetical protein TRFO_39963 [Tritrichomonas foetus]|uniref:Uncharacterized protein n=1 Tax=Tritrichomonas foetus TaxID=1144522 RepID=A0A1J4J913_9EUKA|nr:hypothetical protein TRFO_39963 [Tritrichomonas foetus]|eukprot:OHS93901.1 hypothetical protein TRFO_39963 [Tritrichomonas foetus]